MPTLLVRAKLVELLSLLPMDSHMDSLKEVLLRSGLGRIVNFHATHVGDGTDREFTQGGRGLGAGAGQVASVAAAPAGLPIAVWMEPLWGGRRNRAVLPRAHSLSSRCLAPSA